MTHPFDVFRIVDADVHWIGAVPSLEDALARIRESGRTSPGEYLVLDQKSGDRLVFKSDELVGPQGSHAAERGQSASAPEA
jgi:hypothetical protein